MKGVIKDNLMDTLSAAFLYVIFATQVNTTIVLLYAPMTSSRTVTEGILTASKVYKRIKTSS